MLFNLILPQIWKTKKRILGVNYLNFLNTIFFIRQIKHFACLIQEFLRSVLQPIKKAQLQRKFENENEKFRRESKRQMGEVVHRLPDLIMDIQDKTNIR